jgi:hypothetical protein
MNKNTLDRFLKAGNKKGCPVLCVETLNQNSLEHTNPRKGRYVSKIPSGS